KGREAHGSESEDRRYTTEPHGRRAESDGRLLSCTHVGHRGSKDRNRQENQRDQREGHATETTDRRTTWIAFSKHQRDRYQRVGKGRHPGQPGGELRCPRGRMVPGLRFTRDRHKVSRDVELQGKRISTHR